MESHHHGRPSRAPVNLGSTFGQPWVNLRSTLGQRWVNVGSTFGNLRTYLGPIFADFARVSGETEGLHGVLIRNDQFSNRETAFSGFVLDQSPLRAPWEKKKRIPNVSIDELKKSPRRSSVFSLKKILWFWRDHFPRESAAPSTLSQGKCNFPQGKLSLPKFQMVIVDKKFTPGKDLRLLRGGPGA